MPSDAKVKCCYGCRGAYLRRFGTVSTARAQANRLRRVMFTHGLTEAEARMWMAGWRKGYHAGRQARLRGLRVGSREWERAS
jgi:hypothetical protein